ncbi:predicted protein [Chaetoceros tenuissimus]|uniref:Uncharacterized protein n=1 Tax=Chaetoceros tenuissimus TaxID=426638 RepID=A0AAD3H0Q5_9STRA|nr:predicted protein [Chaetoceros tenuissimus]
MVLRRPDHWYLHYAPHFTDPTGKFASDKILRTLAQERATSHQRLIRINKSYRQHFQNKRHPLRNDMPPTLITSEMLRCPLCNTSSNSATTLHLHLQCTDPSIHKDRIKHIYKINETLEELDLVTQYMIASIYPMTCNTTAPVWEFSTFLRTAIDRTSLITPLTKDQRTEYIATGVYPPFEDLLPSPTPDWTDHTLLPRNKTPTLAHETYLLGPPDTDIPEYPTTHLHVISLLGLLPINTHLAIHEYFHMLLQKYASAAHENANARDLHSKRHLHLSYITDKLALEAVDVQEDNEQAFHKLRQLLNQYKDTDDLGTILRDRFLLLLRRLTQKSVKLQQTIANTLRKEHHNQPTPQEDQPSSKKSKKRKSTKPADTNNKRLKRTPISRHYSCHGPWCTLKKAISLPYTITDHKRICSQCDTMNLATTLSTTIIAHLVCQESALALILHYTSIDPTQYESMVISHRLSNLRIPLDEIREILSNVLSHTDTQQISPAITFLEKDDAQFVPPDNDLLQKILQLIAYACLITTDPHPTREFPPITPAHIHYVLDQATDFCACSHPKAAPHLHTHLCVYCSKLIPNKYRPHENRHKNATTCITCDKVLLYAKHSNTPCDICTMTAILIQRNPKATWISLIKTTTPSVLNHAKTTPYDYISHAISKCASSNTPSMTPADIYVPSVSTCAPPLESSEIDLDFVYQECYDDEPICENPLFRPCPPPTPFPQTYATPARPNAITITNLHLALHPALYNHNKRLHLHYKRPAFPRFDGIRPPAFGYYPEMFFDENVQALARAMPNLHIHKVSPTIIHPHKSYTNQDKDFPHTTVTWSHLEHPHLEPRDPNETLYPTPETFYLTFYPPVQSHSPFQIRLCFQVKDTDDHVINTRNIPSSDIVLYLQRREHPTLFTLTLLYLVVTLPPTFLNNDTVSNYMLTFPDNLRYLHRESTYLHAILHDERYCDALHLITAPWKITYTKTDPDYADHPNDRPNKHNPDNPNTKKQNKKR